MRGLFVVLEGIDGSGKSTASVEIERSLKSKNIATVCLREPTEKTDASREIRRILRTVEKIDARISSELFDLFLIDRLWDLEHQIKPALRQGSVVLLDRYFFSTAAYQAIDDADVEKIMRTYLEDERILLPDLVLYLKLPIGIALERLGARQTLDVFEKQEQMEKTVARYEIAFNLLKETAPRTELIEISHALAPHDFDTWTDYIEERLLKKGQ